MAHKTKYIDATQPDFSHTVQQALIKVAISVSTEASSGVYDIDTKRIQYARQVLENPGRYAQAVAFGAAADGIDKNSTDAEVETRVAAIFNAYAGVRLNITPPPAAPMMFEPPMAPMRAMAMPTPEKRKGAFVRFWLWLWGE